MGGNVFNIKSKHNVKLLMDVVTQNFKTSLKATTGANKTEKHKRRENIGAMFKTFKTISIRSETPTKM